MKWLEALKGHMDGSNYIADVSKFSSSENEHHIVSGRVMRIIWKFFEMDRLIEIAERAEWGDKSDPFVNVCSICGYDQVQFGKDGEHNITCPYSDNWKKIDNLK